MDDETLTGLEVIVPNLHWRYSGVTATNRMIAPRLARLRRSAWLGRDAPEGVERIGWRDLLRLRALPGTAPARLACPPQQRDDRRACCFKRSAGR